MTARSNPSPLSARPLRRWLGGLGVAGLLLIEGAAWGAETNAAEGAPRDPETLTSIEQARFLTHESARRGQPVRVRGVVTISDPRLGRLFVADEHAGVQVEALSTGAPLRVGQWVEIEAWTSSARSAPRLVDARIRALGERALPPSRPVSLGNVASGHQDAQWVEVAGTVRSYEDRADGFAVELWAEGDRLPVWVYAGDKPRAENLVDAGVRMRGVAAPVVDAHGVLRRVEFLVPGVDQIIVDQGPPKDPFAAPLISLRELRRLDPRAASPHRIHTSGSVTYVHHDDSYCFVQDGDHGLLVQLTDCDGIQSGDRVELVAFAEGARGRLTLARALCRRLGPGPAPEPVDLTGPLATAGNYDTRLVRISARLLQLQGPGGGIELTLDGDGAVFTAHLAAADRVVPPDWLEGSLLELTGVWSEVPELVGDTRHDHLMLRSAGDVRVLRHPQWWTRRHTLITLVELGLVVAAGSGWILASRRRLREHSLILEKNAAESANLAKSQFLASMSHEIRTPVTGVMGMLQLLQRTRLDEKQRRYAGNALNSAEALLNVIGDALDFSKIEAGRLELEATPFAVADVVEVAARIVAGHAEDKGVELACRVGDRVPREVIGDPSRLRQVLLNLLSNAIKFTDAGTVALDCDATEVGPDVAVIRFEVRDTGCGIPVEKQTEIFEPYRQADASTSRAHGGTGLGLTISRQLVRLMGGDIEVRSAAGAGATFWFTVRFSRPTTAPAATGSTPDLHGLRVLVVDNAAVARANLCGYVRDWQGQAEEAPDAELAVAMLHAAAERGAPFRVAILDWRMPTADGLVLARRLRSDPALSGLGLVLLSGFAQASLGPEAEAAGVAAVVSKPPRRSELLAAILTAANGGATEAPTVEPAGAPGAGVGVPVPSSPFTILVAEDNEINQEVANELLVALGYRCLRARNGREAVTQAQNGGVDLILMDCQMPVLDGYEATRTIRRWEASRGEATNGRPRRLPIVALTAHAQTGDRARCLEAGMDDYLHKPVECATLERALARWLPGSAPRPAPEPAAETPVARTAVGEGAREGLDYPELLKRCLGRPEQARRIRQKFLAQAEADLQEIEAALPSPEPGRVVQAAHRLKGAAASVSAPAMVESATRLEVLGRQGNLAEAPVLLARLRASLEYVRASVDPWTP